MRVFRPRYRDRTTGQMREAKKLYIDFVDHLQVRHRIPAERCRTKDQAETFGEMVEALVIARHHGERPDVQLDAWLRGLPKSTLKKLSGIGLVDARYVTVNTPLSKHVRDFESWLRDTPIPGRGRKRTPYYVHRVVRSLRRVVNECRFKLWTDIDRQKIERWLGRASETLAQGTLNEYIEAVKCFCSWAVEANLSSESPVKDLKFVKVTKTAKRRALDDDEIQRLIETTARQGERFGMNGIERAVLYLAGLETGFRARELRSLRVGDFDFDADRPYAWRTPAVRLSAEFCKNRQDAEQALRRDRAEQLRAFFAGRDREELAFNVPDSTKTTRMIRRDLRAAGLDIEDAAGRMVVFHSLRHTLATALDRTGVSLKARMDIMRHSTKSHITLGTYTDDTPLIKKRDAVERLPEYPWPLNAKGEQEKIA